jgi:hypothetical protein
MLRLAQFKVAADQASKVGYIVRDLLVIQQ